MTNQNDTAVAIAQALNNTQGFTEVSVARRLDYTGEETPPTVVLANWYGADLSVTVEVLS